MMVNSTRTVNPVSFCRRRQWRRRVLAFSGDSAVGPSPGLLWAVRFPINDLE
jgi:hypothetical protein